MKSKEIRLGEAGQRRFYRILSFLIPFGVMLVCMTLLGGYPFGSKGPGFVGDTGSEYYPCLVLLRRIFRGGEGLLYTWRAGLGTSVVTDMIGTFCNSPYNLLGFLLPDAIYPHYLCFGIALRFGLTGYCLAILLQQISGKAEASVPVFCTAYTLNMWMLTYFWQITMLGNVMLTPLVLLGLLKLVRDRDMRLYPLMLALSLLMNYYMTIFTAIIAGFFWIGLLIVLDKSWREVPKELFKFLGLSVLAAGMAMILLLPSAAALRATSNFEETAFHWTEFYTDFVTLVGQMVPGVLEHINEQPADFAGSILLVLLALGYLTTPTIRLRERLYTFFVAAFIFVSLTYSPLNLLWHGMHYPFVTVQRFAYLMPLVLAFMGWRFTENLHPEKLPENASAGRKAGRVFLTILQFVLMGAAAAGACWCALEKDLTDIVMVPLVAAGVMLLLYLFYRCFPKRKLIFHFSLLVVVTVELSFCTWLTLSHFNVDFTGLKNEISTNSTIEQALSDVSADAKDQLFYRSGFIGQTVNAEQLYDGVQGGSGMFSSLIPYDLKRLCIKLGMEDQRLSSKYYQLDSLPPLSTMLLNMQYVVSSRPVSDGLVMYEPLNGDADTATAYRFAYPTAFGFMIPENISLEDLPDTGLTDVQNVLAQRLTGEQEPIMKYFESEYRVDEATLKDAEASISDGCKLAVKAMKDPRDLSTDADADADAAESLHPAVEVKTTAPEDGIFWLNLTHDDDMLDAVKKWTVTVDDRTILDEQVSLYKMEQTIANQNSLLLGDLKAGAKITVKYYVFSSTDGKAEFRLSRLNEEVFDRVYHKLAESPFTLVDFRSDKFVGTVTAKDNSLLYLSMPYREGWSVTVDGAQTNTVKALGGMTGVYLMAGTHSVKLEYHQPYLLEGAIISGACLLLYLILVLIQCIGRAIARKRGYILDEPLPDVPAAPEKKPAAPAPKAPSAPDAPKPVTAARMPAPPPAQPAAPKTPAAPAPAPASEKPAAPAAPAAKPAEKKPEAPAASESAKPAAASSAGERRRPGLYENHRPQQLKPEDEAEARFVRGAHFAGDDGDDDADD